VGTVILLRHARSTANGSGVLSGRRPGIELADEGRRQATDLIGRLADVPLAALVRSPLLRCEQTLQPLSRERDLEPVVDEELSEVHYGDWAGRKLGELMQEPLWRVVQAHPSAAVFPGGEGLADVQARAVAAVRRHDAQIAEQHGEHAVWLLCSHGDVLKSIIADALGQHLDAFQRIVVDPASISVVRYTELRPFVLRLNDNGGSLASAVPNVDMSTPEAEHESDAVIGGSTGA
jgi:probable phosphomutase (TIGR03848 family)